ncbi:MAG: hypothetical protein F6J89_01525 [Symploca sp. SIO1C4]|uniref:Uncharacterized protein n=1 Tax=Symploca sp. SIO1C4 TaxID=2607765 RepID=A0A6B3N9R1_9CYAN|nr:hypothetical protein [Symploca sp. SIO1C4]
MKFSLLFFGFSRSSRRSSSTDYETLLDVAQKTHDIFDELKTLKKQLKTWAEL